MAAETFETLLQAKPKPLGTRARVATRDRIGRIAGAMTYIVAAIAGGLIGGFVVAAMFPAAAASEWKPAENSPVQTQPPGYWPVDAERGASLASRPPSWPSSAPGGFCNGDETFCTTTTTSKPTETLQKLAAAIPQGSAKKYRVQLSVVPVEE